MSLKMGNEAMAVHGQDPQNLIETILRNRIYESLYWKECCHGLNTESLLERAVELQCFGGHYGNQKPTDFVCLLLKLLQIQPTKEIVYELIADEDFKYLRTLAAFYLRLVGTPAEIYTYLEPLLNDYRKLRKKLRTGTYEITYIDEFIDELLREDRVCDIILPPLTKRYLLEENDELPPHISILEEEMEEEVSASDSEVEGSPSKLSNPSESSTSASPIKKFEIYSGSEASDDECDKVASPNNKEHDDLDKKIKKEMYSLSLRSPHAQKNKDDKKIDESPKRESRSRSRTLSYDSKGRRGRRYSRSSSRSSSYDLRNRRSNRHFRSRSRSYDSTSRRNSRHSRSRRSPSYDSRSRRNRRYRSRSSSYSSSRSTSLMRSRSHSPIRRDGSRSPNHSKSRK